MVEGDTGNDKGCPGGGRDKAHQLVRGGQAARRGVTLTLTAQCCLEKMHRNDFTTAHKPKKTYNGPAIHRWAAGSA
jgi:hypothetical protein